MSDPLEDVDIQRKQVFAGSLSQRFSIEVFIWFLRVLGHVSENSERFLCALSLNKQPMRSCKTVYTVGAIRGGAWVEWEGRVSVVLAAGLFTLSSSSDGDASYAVF